MQEMKKKIIWGGTFESGNINSKSFVIKKSFVFKKEATCQVSKSKMGGKIWF